MDKSEKALVYALDSVTWYNGLAETVFSWRSLEPSGYCIACPHNYGLAEDCEWAWNQLQVIWMIACEAFGECGTSPRFGWITDFEGFRQFCLDITELWRSSEDYSGPKEYFAGDGELYPYTKSATTIKEGE